MPTTVITYIITNSVQPPHRVGQYHYPILQITGRTPTGFYLVQMHLALPSRSLRQGAQFSPPLFHSHYNTVREFKLR